MDKRKLSMILAIITAVLLVLSVPVGYWFLQAGAILRWSGLAVGIAYLIVRSKAIKES